MAAKIDGGFEAKMVGSEVQVFGGDPVVAIEKALLCFEKFDQSAHLVIEGFHNVKHPLYPNQAEKVIAIAAKRFGKEGAIESFKLLKGAFIKTPWYERDALYPENQLSLLRLFADTTDLKTTLFVLKELEFYEQPDHPVFRTCYRDKGQDASFRLCKNWDLAETVEIRPEDLLAPIQILGEQFGLEGAKAGVEEARNHAAMKRDEELPQKIENYFREKFGEERAHEIKGDLKYKSHVSDFIPLNEGNGCAIL